MRNTFPLIITGIFILLSIAFFTLKGYAPDYRLNVLIGGNMLMALLSVASFYIVKKTLGERPQAFIRGVYSGTFLKLMVCMSSVLAYALLNKKNIHKPSLFILFGIYIIYTIAETWYLSKIAKNAK